MMRLGLAWVLLLLSMPSAWAGSPRSLEDTLGQAGRFKTYLALRDVAGPALAGGGRHTFLVPNDRAFAALPKDVLDRLMHDPAKARELLDRLTLKGDMKANELAGRERGKGRRHQTEQGATVEIRLPPAEPAPAPEPTAAAAPDTSGSIPLAITLPSNYIAAPELPPISPTPPPEPTVQTVMLFDIPAVMTIETSEPRTVVQQPLVIQGLEGENPFIPVVAGDTAVSGGTAHEVGSLGVLFEFNLGIP